MAIQKAEQVEEIRKLTEKVFRENPLPWEADTEKNDGDFGIGDETESGYLGYAMFDANGKRLFGSENSDAGCIKVEDDEDGSHAWDIVAEQNFALIAKLVSALPDLLAPSHNLAAAEQMVRAFADTYTGMAEHGGSGSWVLCSDVAAAITTVLLPRLLAALTQAQGGAE
jgi:hypothetical protein